VRLTITVVGLALAAAGSALAQVVPDQPARTSASTASITPAFTVRLLPLDTTGAGVANKALLEKIHTRMAARLRAIPGLTLLDQAPASANGTVNYEVEMRPRVGRGVQLADFRVRTLSQPAPTILELRRAESASTQPDRAPVAAPGGESGDRGSAFIGNTIANLRPLPPFTESRTFTMIDGRRVVTTSNQADVVDLNIIPLNLLQRMDVVYGFGERADPERDMESFIHRLQVTNFPADPSLKATLLDPRAGSSRRLKTLDLLLTPAMGGELPPEPSVIRAGVELATTARDPAHRSAIWKQLRDSRSPEIMGPLVQALGTEKDAQVRLDLVGILSRDFSTDPEARAALESVARTDRREITRMAAQRALTGDAPWNEYVIATLGNPRLRDAQRLAPLAYLESSSLYAQGRPELDDAAMHNLGMLVAKAQTHSPGVRGAASVLASSSNPVAIDVVVDILRPRKVRSRTNSAVRDTVLWQTGSRGRMDPRVRAVFEEVATGDSDPAVRGTAQAALESEARMKAREANPSPRQ
jgi:hypothetical protein